MANNENLVAPIAPGEVRNKRGRPKDPPALALIKKLTVPESRALIYQVGLMTSVQRRQMMADPNCKDGLSQMIAAIMEKVIETGDPRGLQFLWERLFGKVKEEVNVTSENDGVLVVGFVRPSQNEAP